MSQVSFWRRLRQSFGGSAPEPKLHGLHPPADGVRPQLADLIRLRREAKALTRDSRKRQVTSAVGGYASTHRGRGLDFEEVRIYQPGDDIRTMDWRVTARTGEAHTKIFRDERERPTFFCVDQGPSMSFGSRVCFKSVVAARTAAVLAWTAAASGDRIGGVVYSEKKRIELPLKGRSDGALRLCHALSSVHDDADAVSFNQISAFQRLSQLVSTGNLVFVISDFYQLNKASTDVLTRLAQKAEVVLITIFDPLERQLALAGQYPITNGSDFLTLDLTSQAARKSYQEVYESRLAQVRNLSHSSGCSLIELCSQDNLTTVLANGLNTPTS